MSQQKITAKINFAVQAYESLYFGHTTLRTPYYINYPGLSYESTLKDKFGEEDMQKVQELRRGQRFLPWAFQGKGRPGEIVYATERIAESMRQPLQELSAEGIELIMRLFGIGVDCSGFVFNVLSSALDLDKQSEVELLQGLESRGVFRGNVKKFAAPENSSFVDFSSAADLRPGDIIVDSPSHTHIMLIVDVQGNELTIAHSAMYTLPQGVNTFKCHVENRTQLEDALNALPNVYTYAPQNTYEIRRLRVMAEQI